MSVQTRKWSREEYERLVALGVLREDEPVQLVEGEIVQMSPQNAPHATAVRLVEEALRRVAGEGFDVRAQLPLALGPDSEPEPDVAVVRGGPRDYRDRHPVGEDTVLVVEVAESTWRFDRERKGRVYALAEIAEYWIVNLDRRVLEVYRSPKAGDYQDQSTVEGSGSVAPLFRPDARVAVADLLP
ncbi:MAG: Uma2 family endonuclease [Armatimonadota bacterium]|nr:Uma2 family endonuclease [Armatimonadota bacterium]MDR7412335.1 Uma2 family endonuclease [Armatimonadota bacterium]